MIESDWSSFLCCLYPKIRNRTIWRLSVKVKMKSWCVSGRDPCVDNPCHNNGTCVHVGTSSRCYCPEGFEGRYCDTGQKIIHDKWVQATEFCRRHETHEFTVCLLLRFRRRSEPHGSTDAFWTFIVSTDFCYFCENVDWSLTALHNVL